MSGCPGSSDGKAPKTGGQTPDFQEVPFSEYIQRENTQKSKAANEQHQKAGDLFADPKVAALAKALERTDLTKAEQLLREGVDINATGQKGITLPTWTMLSKNKVSFRWLLEHGANHNYVPEEDRGVLFWASAIDDADWLEMLLEHKADPNLKRKGNIYSVEVPLDEAILHKRIKNLELLIKAGADVNFPIPPNDGGGTRAVDAASIGWLEGVYMLLEAGADYRPRTVGGWDLTYEVIRRSEGLNTDDTIWCNKVLRLLQERGADVEAARKKIRDDENRKQP